MYCTIEIIWQNLPFWFLSLSWASYPFYLSLSSDWPVFIWFWWAEGERQMNKLLENSVVVTTHFPKTVVTIAAIPSVDLNIPGKMQFCSSSLIFLHFLRHYGETHESSSSSSKVCFSQECKSTESWAAEWNATTNIDSLCLAKAAFLAVSALIASLLLLQLETSCKIYRQEAQEVHHPSQTVRTSRRSLRGGTSSFRSGSDLQRVITK